jgi:hypothetical protein
VIHVVRDSAERYFIVTADLRHLLAFDKNGRLIPSTLERIKSFGRITNVLLSTEATLQLYDIESRALVTLSKDLEPVSSTPLAHRPSLLMSDGQYLVAQQITTPDLVGHPLHIMDASGRIVRSFGSEPPSYNAREPYFNDRVVALSSDGTIWSAAPGRHIVERWNASGKRLSRIEIKSAWFRSTPGPAPRNERPSPNVLAIWEDGDILWLLSRDADAKWAPPPAVGGGERGLSADEYQRTYDWILEAVHIPSETLVATRRFDFPLSRRGHSSAVASWEGTEGSAATRIRLSQAHLASKGRKQ